MSVDPDPDSSRNGITDPNWPERNFPLVTDPDQSPTRTRRRRAPRRPKRLSVALIDALAVAHREGLPTSVACATIGLPESTYYQWTRRGNRAIAEQITDAGEAPYRRLAEEVERAKAEGEATLIRKLLDAAAGGHVTSRRYKDGQLVHESTTAPDWRAYAWLLERKHGWYRRDMVQIADVATPPTGLSAPDVLRDVEATRLLASLTERLAGLRNEETPDHERRNEDD